MNRLELGMRHSNPDERGAVSGIVKERLQLPQSDRHFVGRRRNKFGLVQAATYGTNPVLMSSQISGIQVKTSSMAQEFGVDFANQPHGNRKFVQAFQAVIHRFNIISASSASCG